MKATLLFYTIAIFTLVGCAPEPGSPPAAAVVPAATIAKKVAPRVDLKATIQDRAWSSPIWAGVAFRRPEGPVQYSYQRAVPYLL